MKRILIASLAALIIFVIGVTCGGLWMKHRYSSKNSQTNPSIPSDTLITLERTGCYGPCPTYTVVISADGRVIFSGTYFAKVNGSNQFKKSGVIESNISDQQLRELIAEFNRANYFSLRDSYRDARDGCPDHLTDMSSAYTSIQINGRKKSVEHYLGCRYDGSNGAPYPNELVAVEAAIDQIVNTKQWMQ